MTVQPGAAPQGAAQPVLAADDLNLVGALADQAKDESELWNEFEEAEKTTAASPDDMGKAAEPSAETEAQPQAQTTKEAPVSTQQPAAAASPAPAADIWANATPEQKAAYEAAVAERSKFEQRFRSESGRVSALTKKINAAAQPGRQTPNAREAIASIRTDYPEIAQPLEKVVEAIEGQAENLNRVQTGEVEAAREELHGIVQAETAMLTEKHPDYADVLKKNGQAFVDWVEDQPRRIREAARMNASFIADGAAAIEVIDGFKKHLAGLAAPAQQQPSPAQQREAQPPVQPQPNLSDRRQRQIQGTSAPQRGGGQATVSGIPADGDPEALWKQWDDLERARA